MQMSYEVRFSQLPWPRVMRRGGRLSVRSVHIREQRSLAGIAAGPDDEDSHSEWSRIPFSFQIMTQFRTENDTMGPVQVPAQAYYGAQTQRAVDNFPVSGQCLAPGLIHANFTTPIA